MGFGRLTLRALKPPSDDYPAHPVTFGDHVLRRRLDLGLMFKEVGDIIGVNSKTTWTGEHDSVEPHALRRVA